MKLRCAVLAPLLGVCLLPIPAASRAEAGVALEPVQASPQQGPFEPVPGAPKPGPERRAGPAIVAIEFQGAKRIQPAVLQAMIVCRVGDPYDPEVLRRDTQSLLRTGRFSDVKQEKEESRSGPIVRFVLVELPVIQSVEYQGREIVTVPEILARFEQRKIPIRPETLFRREDLERAVGAVRALLAEKGGEDLIVSTTVEPIWPSTGVQEWPPAGVKIIFRAEGRQ
ncbi:MAG: hypothetical protein J0H49_12795 [Acidobacteria bacterium]|nr:hypothetical protein [Acidobacteriota bacterium]